MSTPASASADKPAASNAKADKKDKKAGKGAGASSSPQGANPEYLEHRLKIWDQLWAEHVAARKRECWLDWLNAVYRSLTALSSLSSGRQNQGHAAGWQIA